MSSTNRGYDRHKADYYTTPIPDIINFLGAWLGDMQEHYYPIADRPDKHLWLDPCAGGDKNHPMSYPTALKQIGVEADTIDIREDSLAEIKGNYLEMECKGYDVIITNPPFNQALPIIQKALNEVNNGGYVIMLLRLNFFGSVSRFSFLSDNMPKYCYVHHKRMGFTDDGKTDSIEYAHFVWQKGVSGAYTRLYLI